MNHTIQRPGTARFFEWIGRYVRPIVAVTVLVALALGGLFAVVADTDEPQFDPEGEIYTMQERAEATLVSESTIGSATFLVEAFDGGDVLTAAAFQEWKVASDRVRSNHDGRLVDRFDPDLGSPIPGVTSVVDLIDKVLPHGLSEATDKDVKMALAAIFADGVQNADFRFTLSEQAKAITDPDGTVVWTSPAFATLIVYNEAGFDDEAAAKLWLRSVQADFRESASVTNSIGVAIDIETTFEEAALSAAPFIFLAVSLIVMLIALVHRSYWSSALVASGLGLTMLSYNGIAALVGLKMGSMLISFIVPIALISFGVDFYIHGTGRVREMQVDGLDRRSAYAAGMTAVFTAMLLAVSTSVAAFLANALSGTEAIFEFGVAAAIGLIVAYVVLGMIAPRVLLAVDQTVGPNKVAGKSRWAYRAMMLPSAIVSGLAVTMAAIQPRIGTGAVAAMLVIVVFIPVVLTRGRNRRAADSGHPVDETIRGSAHGLTAAGTVVRGVAKWRRITLPVAIGVGAIGIVAALQVDSGFEVRDFLSSSTDFARSINRANEHFPSSGEGPAMVYIEGDLTHPENLVAIDTAVKHIDASSADFGRNSDGELIVARSASDAVRLVMAEPTIVAAVAVSTGTPSSRFPTMTGGLRIDGLHKRFGDIVALRGVNLEVPRGQLVGFLGPNGAGKTTTMRGVMGLVAMDAGSVTWDGRTMTEEDRHHIGYMPQERGLYPGMKVHEHIAYIGRLAGLDRDTANRRANQWAERAGLAERGNDLIQELSTGNQQRVQLAVALVHEPDLMILDEPFAGLDPVAVSMLSDIMAEQVEKGVSVVFSSHQLDLVQDLAEHVTIVAGGETRATGTVADLRYRSPHRILEIRWAGPVASWSPQEGETQDAPQGVSRFVVPAKTDAAALIAQASTAGALAAVSYLPPDLDEVFLDLVGR